MYALIGKYILPYTDGMLLSIKKNDSGQYVIVVSLSPTTTLEAATFAAEHEARCELREIWSHLNHVAILINSSKRSVAVAVRNAHCDEKEAGPQKNLDAPDAPSKEKQTE